MVKLEVGGYAFACVWSIGHVGREILGPVPKLQHSKYPKAIRA